MNNEADMFRAELIELIESMNEEELLTVKNCLLMIHAEIPED